MTSPVATLVRHWANDNGGRVFAAGAQTNSVITYEELRRRIEAPYASPDESHCVALALSDPVEFAGELVRALAHGRWVAPLDPSLGAADPARLIYKAHSLGCATLIRDGDNVTFNGATARRHGGGIVLASSGTTGTPKVMCLGVDQLLSAAALIARHNELTPDDRGFNPLPLFHINAEVVGVLASLTAGAGLILDDRFHRTDFWPLVERTGATWINAVPAIIHRLLPLREGETVAPRIRFIRSASAPLPAALLAEFQRVTGLAVLESYGMTEGASQICANPLHGPRKPGSVGLPVGVSLRVVDAVGDECRPYEVGQVTLQGPTIITAYESPGYDDRFRDGWLLTGDLGYLDSDGYVFLVGRTDDVINRGGEKIMPREIEEILTQIPGVAGAVVVGEADDVFGQVPVAYIELEGLASAGDISAHEALVATCRQTLLDSLPRGRRPDRMVVVDALPRHATGKIQRGAVRAGDVRTLMSVAIS